MKLILLVSIATTCVALIAPAAQASIVWSAGPGDITFVHDANSDPTLAANQDRITANVWITRGLNQGIFNAKTESTFNDAVSPQDTQWAASGITDPSTGITNPVFAYGQGALNNSNLHFSLWDDAFGASMHLQGNIVVAPAVLRILSQDIYIDVRFLSWGNNNGGSFTYQRAVAPVPEPASLGASLVGVILLMCRTRKVRY